MADEPLSRVEEILEGGSPPLLSRIEKLLQEGGAGGGASPEQIAAAVEAYLDEHGVTVTETDPTVPEWAKAEQKPSYTATEVGALPDSYTPPVTSVNGRTGAVTVKEPYYLTVTEDNDTVYVDKTPTEIDALSAAGYDVHLRHVLYSGSLELRVDYAFVGYYPAVQMAALTVQYSGITYAAIIHSDKSVSFETTDLDEQIAVIDGELNLKANTAELAAVATSGSYDDLTDKPSIPSLSGYATEQWVENKGYLTQHQSLAAYQTKSITDTGGYFTIDTVEGALQEIGGKLLPSGGSTGDFLRKTASGVAWQTVPSAESNSFGGGS